eukprot:5850452-Prymnesium_polylepis.1
MPRHASLSVPLPDVGLGSHRLTGRVARATVQGVRTQRTPRGAPEPRAALCRPRGRGEAERRRGLRTREEAEERGARGGWAARTNSPVLHVRFSQERGWANWNLDARARVLRLAEEVACGRRGGSKRPWPRGGSLAGNWGATGTHAHAHAHHHTRVAQHLAWRRGGRRHVELRQRHQLDAGGRLHRDAALPRLQQGASSRPHPVLTHEAFGGLSPHIQPKVLVSSSSRRSAACGRWWANPP